MNARKELIADYKRRKKEIGKRLREFEDVRSGSGEDIFAELCFCLFTPQSKAISCDNAVKELRVAGLLMNGDKRAIASRLKGLVRFHNNKAGYVVVARRYFSDGRDIEIKAWLGDEPRALTRDRLVKNVKGLGFKEAGHFLRNIGLGRELAILDVHILRNLKRYGVIKDIPASLTEARYKEIEKKLRLFSREVAIPMGALDLLFWSRQTGYVFK